LLRNLLDIFWIMVKWSTWPISIDNVSSFPSAFPWGYSLCDSLASPVPFPYKTHSFTQRFFVSSLGFLWCRC
jgi:hypothetical protein